MRRQYTSSEIRAFNLISKHSFLIRLKMKRIFMYAAKVFSFLRFHFGGFVFLFRRYCAPIES